MYKISLLLAEQTNKKLETPFHVFHFLTIHLFFFIVVAQLKIIYIGGDDISPILPLGMTEALPGEVESNLVFS